MIRFDHCTRFVTLTNLNWDQVLANWFVGQATNKGGVLSWFKIYSRSGLQ